MENQSSGTAVEYDTETRYVPWKWLERRPALLFMLGGVLLVASSVVAIGAGLLGTVPRVHNRGPWLARIGALCATVAGVAAIALVVLVGTAVTAAVTFGTALPKPMGVFQALALAIASGLSLGFILLGVARVRSNDSADTPGRLLVVGGVVLLVSALGEFLRLSVGIGPPPWVIFGALGVLTLDSLAVGYSLRTTSLPPSVMGSS